MSKVVVFGFDVAEAAQIRRIRSIRALGHEVHSFTMRRRNMNAAFEPEWPNTHLYHTANRDLARRAATVLASMLRMVGHRPEVGSADVILARNLDMLAIAWAARLVAGATSTPLVYECLDVHASLTGRGRGARVLRGIEALLLRRIALLVVSSPGFVERYFAPVQGHRGPWHLMENKLALDPPPPPRPEGPRRAGADAPLVLGWVGTIRCLPSLRLLTAAAEALGDGLRIAIHGVVHDHLRPEVEAAVARHDNVTHHGPYAYPDEIARVYGGCDLVWAQDLWRRGANSDWLLPNRIYEASWCGCPSIALAGTETGRRVAADGLGFTIDRPEPGALVALLRSLSRGRIEARSAELLGRPRSAFQQQSQEVQDMLDAAMAA